MRYFLTAVVLTGLLTVSAVHADTMKNCAAGWKATSAADQAKTTYAAYSKMCLAKSYTVPAAAPAMSATAPAGATGQCKDGTYTMSKTHSGACSSHGGVAKWL